MRKPDFGNMLAVLNRQVPRRPVLFELFLNNPLYSMLAGRELPDFNADPSGYYKTVIDAFASAGYDYATVHASDFHFGGGNRVRKDTLSLNDGGVVNDRESFDKYKWIDPAKCDYSRLDLIEKLLPENMKVIVMGPGGVLENAISICGFDNLCFMIKDNRGLAAEVFENVGNSLVEYYRIASSHPAVGACISNDDWGFNTQTFLSLGDMREFVFPYHKKIVEVCHANGRPVILHSCGYATDIMDDIIDDMKFDAKHSYEDVIMPVEQVYDRWSDRIAVFGGLDVDFVCRRLPAEVAERARFMLIRSKHKGAYALGTGNSVPEFMPVENYKAMISVVSEFD